jgi:hypothetical protein
MKYLKALCFAFIGVTSLMVAMGAGAASASILCSTETSPCTGTVYGSGTKISAQLKAGTTAKLTSSFGTVTCKSSSLSGKTTNGEGHMTITEMNTGSCTDSLGGNCTETATHLPWTGEWHTHWWGGGYWVYSEDGKGEPKRDYECPATGMECEFGSPEFALEVNGGNPAIAISKEVPLEGGEGISCPSEAFLDAEWEITSPKPLFLA